MTLPAHRFEQRKKKNNRHVFTCDFDETITTSPDRMACIAEALKAQGHTIIVVTGNESPRAEIVRKLDDYGFPFDDLVQYGGGDAESNPGGLVRAEVLKQLNAWCAFDNRADRAYVYAKICPHLYLIAKPSAEEEDEAQPIIKAALKKS